MINPEEMNDNVVPIKPEDLGDLADEVIAAETVPSAEAEEEEQLDFNKAA